MYFWQVCAGSRCPTADGLRSFVKDDQKLKEWWGMPNKDSLIEYTLNGTESGRLEYSEKSWQYGKL